MSRSSLLLGRDRVGTAIGRLPSPSIDYVHPDYHKNADYSDILITNET